MGNTVDIEAGKLVEPDLDRSKLTMPSDKL